MIDRVAGLSRRGWFAYAAVVLVQLRALWGLWDNDLTPGDSSSYFAMADRWYDDAELRLAWSPLYSVYYASVRALVGGDAVAAENLHRALLVVAVAVLLLALARRLLPAAVALLVACWWAALPINFDSIYEVHLFAPPFLLGTALLLTDDPGPWRRGSAFALLLLSGLLVRNEAMPVVGLLAAALLAAEIRARRRGQGTPTSRLAPAVGVPLLVVVLIVGAAYTRGIEQGGDLRDSFVAKERLNVCQAYAVNFQQRHPDKFSGNPFTGCRPLMQQVFGEPRPTLRAAWSANSRAMVAYTAWHVRLLPHGLQLGLFDAVSGDDNPDYVPAKLNRLYAALLSVLLLALLLAGGRALWLDRSGWAPELRRQRWAWLALAAIGIGTLVVCTFFQRPRPSYMFGLSIALMLTAGLALAALVRRRRLERALGLAAVATPLVLMALLPVHYSEGADPLADSYRRLKPVAARIAAGETVLVPAFSGDVCNYVAPHSACRAVDVPAVIPPKRTARALEHALAANSVRILYADPALAAQPHFARLIGGRGDGRWRVANSGREGGRRWAVLVRE